LAKEAKADSSVLPMNIAEIDEYCVEEMLLDETFINYQTNEGKVIMCSVEKKGSKSHFTYTLKLTLMKNNQNVLKKKNISAGEYIQFKSQIKEGTKTVRSKRVAIIDNGVYIIVDYYFETDGQPMIGIIQVKQSNQQHIDLPKYIKTFREVTDEP